MARHALAMPVTPSVTPGPAVIAATPMLCGLQRAQAVGRVHGRLLVAHVDDLDALVDAAVVEGHDVPARQGEDDLDAGLLEGLRRELSAVEGHGWVSLVSRFDARPALGPRRVLRAPTGGRARYHPAQVRSKRDRTSSTDAGSQPARPVSERLVVFWQITTTELTAFQFVGIPGFVNTWIRPIAVTLNLNFSFVLTAYCIETSLFEILRLTTLLPLVVTLVAVAACWICYHTKSISNETYVKLEKRATFVALVLTYVIYPISSTAIIQTFRCSHDFPRGKEPPDSPYAGTSFLLADMSVSCNSPAYNFYFAYALVFVFVIPVGIPLGYFCVLCRFRDRLNPPNMVAFATSIVDGTAPYFQHPRRVLRRQNATRKLQVAVGNKNRSKDDDECDDDERTTITSREEAVLREKAMHYLQVREQLDKLDDTEILRPGVSHLEDELVSAHHKLDMRCAHYAFLSEEYRRDRWFWESIECVRRIALTSVVAAAVNSKSHSDVRQVHASIFVALFFLYLHVREQPYAHADLNWLATVFQATVAAVLAVLALLYAHQHQRECDEVDSSAAAWEKTALSITLLLLLIALGPLTLLYDVKRDVDLPPVTSFATMAETRMSHMTGNVKEYLSSGRFTLHGSPSFGTDQDCDDDEGNHDTILMEITTTGD